MKREITRRDVVAGLKTSIVARGFDDASTRRGKLEQTFHIDGERIIGRGTVSQGVVGVETLKKIHDEVYMLGRMKDKFWVYVTYGTYSAAAVRYATAHRIWLYTFDKNGQLTSQSAKPVTEAAKAVFQALLGLLLGAAMVAGLVAGIVWIFRNVDVGAGIEIVFFILAGIVVLSVSAAWTALSRGDKKD